jgi:hypothetical protein
MEPHKTSSFDEKTMDIDIKFRSSDDWKLQLTAAVSGPIELQDIISILGVIAEKAQRLLDCGVLIDLRKATFTCKTLDVHSLANHLASTLWPLKNKIAIVPASDFKQYDLMLLLCSGASFRGFKVTTFHDLDRALEWLAEDD